MTQASESSDDCIDCERRGPAADTRTPHGVHEGPDNHLALVYESHDEQLAAVIPFVRQGLERDERVLYVVDQNTEAELVDAFRSAGVDVDEALESGALSFHSKEDTYTRDGPFDPDAMIEYLDQTVREAVAGDEYDRVRVTGEMTWVLGEDVDTLELLVEYESKINQFYPESPVTGLCQYDRTAFEPELLYDVIRAHPHQVYNATVCQNFAYLPPEEFFAASAPAVEAERNVQMHLDRVRTQGKLEHREETLDALARSSRNLLAGDEREIVDQTVATLQQGLDPTVVAVFQYDEAADDLHPEAVAFAGDVVDASVTLPARHRELLWDAFVSDEPNVFENVQSGAEIPELGAALQSGVVVPIDRHGVLFVASTRAYAFDEADVQFVSTVATTATAAFERAEREQTLERQNEQLRSLSRLNRTIRSIDQAVIRASTREDVERAVCERLSESDHYRFAWIGSRDPLDEGLEVRQWAGEGERYLDDVRVRTPGGVADDVVSTDRSTDGSSRAIVNGPERTALETGETQVVPNALTDTMFTAWRKAALAAGFHSCISVPLRHDDTEFGVLNVYAEEPRAFDEMERDVLVELGATIAFAIDAVETRVGVFADRTVELRLRITEGPDWVLSLARELDCRVDVETVLPGADERVRLFLSVADADPDEVQAFAEGSVSVTSIRHVAEFDDGHLFEAVLDGRTVAAAVAAHNAATRRLTADGGGATLTVDLPQTQDPRQFVQSLTDEYPGLDVVSIRRRNRSVQTHQSFFSTLQEQLTPKQLEALQVAYYGGYFESPRDSTAADIAGSLGISQPTFSGHLRTGQRKLFRELFD